MVRVNENSSSIYFVIHLHLIDSTFFGYDDVVICVGQMKYEQNNRKFSHKSYLQKQLTYFWLNWLPYCTCIVEANLLLLCNPNNWKF